VADVEPTQQQRQDQGPERGMLQSVEWRKVCGVRDAAEDAASDSGLQAEASATSALLLEDTLREEVLAGVRRPCVDASTPMKENSQTKAKS
jgi:hypothetical protein